MSEKVLPEKFSKLTSWVAEWALPNEEARYLKLHAVTFEQLKAFYDAMLPEMEAIMVFLKTQPVEGMPSEAQNLYRLAMTFAETAHPLDLGWTDTDFPSAFPWERMGFRSVSTQF
jgi:hypothetical protein